MRMERKPWAAAILDSLYIVLSDNRYVAGMLVASLLFGASYALLPLFFIPGARFSPASILNSLSPLDLVLLGVLSILFGLVLALQICELKRVVRKSARGRAATLGGTIAGLIAAKSCCILPLLLLIAGSVSAAILVATYLTLIRAAGAAIMVVVFVFTAVRVGRVAVPQPEGASACGCGDEMGATP